MRPACNIRRIGQGNWAIRLAPVNGKNNFAVILENDPLNRDYNDLMLEISLAGGFRREEVQTYFRMYEITGDEKYRLTANYMIPSAPAFSNLGGDSDF